MSRSDHQPLPQSDESAPDFDVPAEPEQVSVSLIGSGTRGTDRKNGYSTYSEPDFENSSENPYRDTTESDINLRHIPLGDLVPRPWKTFEQVMIASYVSLVFFIITGLMAVRYARRGKRHQSKDVYKYNLLLYNNNVMNIFVNTNYNKRLPNPKPEV
ncbi:hypothetical protein Btru_062590 [Bulinus truncatus]|nr:hypothetical protein Btru_062590 [Bulinus truncatus]